MHQSWLGFYQLIGEASGALIGLLFIVATLTAGQEQSGISRGVVLYTTPTVFHLCFVLLLSAVALAPEALPRLRPLLGVICCLVGFVYAGWRAIGIARSKERSHWTDFWCYGAAPALNYFLLTLAAFAAWNRTPYAGFMLAGLLLMLLMLAIRNAWDLVTWLAPRTKRASASPVGPGLG